MKTYTQEDFDALRRGDNGTIIVPEGNWENVDFRGADRLVFASGCRLGAGCELGDECKLGDGRELGEGCELGDGCELGAGCWFGGLDDFVERVREVHGGTRHEADYLAFAAFARARFARYAEENGEERK